MRLRTTTAPRAPCIALHSPSLAAPQVEEVAGQRLEPEPLRESNLRQEIVRGRIRPRDEAVLGGLQVRALGVDGSVLTDATGAFEIEGAFSTTGVLLLELPSGGWRASALPVRDAVTHERAELIWDAQEPFRRRPAPAADRALERKLALELLLPLVEKHAGKPGGYLGTTALQSIARVNGALSIRLAQDSEFDDPSELDSVIGRSVAILAEQSPMEALGFVEEMEPGMSRSWQLLSVGEVLGGDEEVELLEAHFDEARRIEPVMYRVVVLARMGSRLRDIDETDLAERVFDEARLFADDLGAEEWPGYARARLGVALAKDDFEEGLKWIHSSDPEDWARHYGNVALSIAGSEPAKAADLLAQMNGMAGTWRASRWAGRVAYEMAGADLKRARQVAKDHDPEGFADLLVALRLHEIGRSEEAAEALQFAVHRHFKGVEPHGHLAMNPNGSTGAFLRWTPVIAAGQVPQVIALALTPGPKFGRDQLALDMAAVTAASNAYFLIDLDAELAGAVLAPGVEALIARSKGEGPDLSLGGSEVVWASLARLDPERAAQAAREVGERATLTVGTILAMTPGERTEYVHARLLGLWEPGSGGF